MALWVDAVQAGSVLFGVGTWVLTHRKDMRREKVQKTVDLLMPFTTSDRLAAGNVLVARLIGTGVSPKLGESKEVDDTLIDLLDYYEFLYELLQRDVLDGNTVLQLRGRLLGATYKILGPYIEELRTKHGRGVYSTIRGVVEQYRLDSDAPTLTM